MSNSTALLLKLLAWINIIGGIFSSIYLGSLYETRTASKFLNNVFDGSYNWPYALAGIIASITLGAIFLGLAEVIVLLEENVIKSSKIELLLSTAQNNKKL